MWGVCILSERTNGVKGVTVRDLLETLVDGLDRPALSTLGVIPWGWPGSVFSEI